MICKNCGAILVLNPEGTIYVCNTCGKKYRAPSKNKAVQEPPAQQPVITPAPGRKPNLPSFSEEEEETKPRMPMRNAYQHPAREEYDEDDDYDEDEDDEDDDDEEEEVPVKRGPKGRPMPVRPTKPTPPPRKSGGIPIVPICMGVIIVALIAVCVLFVLKLKKTTEDLNKAQEQISILNEQLQAAYAQQTQQQQYYEDTGAIDENGSYVVNDAANNGGELYSPDTTTEPVAEIDASQIEGATTDGGEGGDTTTETAEGAPDGADAISPAEQATADQIINDLNQNSIGEGDMPVDELIQ